VCVKIRSALTKCALKLVLWTRHTEAKRKISNFKIKSHNSYLKILKPISVHKKYIFNFKDLQKKYLSRETIPLMAGMTGFDPMQRRCVEDFIEFNITAPIHLKVHKNENFFGFDFEFCTISLLVMSKY
jgi:hypothetical protein